MGAYENISQYLPVKKQMLVECLACLWSIWNNPYPDEKVGVSTLYTSFTEEPKHLDPALSYASNEWAIINQIYEPPLQYHYLKRPYTLEPLVAQAMPVVSTTKRNGIITSIYDIKIKPGIYYQPHAAFAHYKNSTRELVANDFVYQIKRLGDPSLNSPVFGLMQNTILGLDAFEKNLREKYEKKGQTLDQSVYIDLNPYALEGAKVISKYHYQIKIKGVYPQFIYWLAMPFFAPMPWEAIRYYAQPKLSANNVSLDYYPIGTGPFMVSENDPNARIVLVKNPNYRRDLYPFEDNKQLKNQPMPFLDKVVFTREAENIPYWNKFLQGYYDQSAIASDSFDQALQSASNNSGLELTPELKAQHIQLNTSILPSVFYWGFNMMDPIVGGYSEPKRKLRQAISIAMDIEEYIDLFLNGRGVVATSPIPEGIFGLVAKKERQTLEQAKTLLAQAGYPNGIDPKTKAPLMLYLDATMGGGPDSNAMFAWTRKQFKKLNIELVVRATQYNRFQEKMRTGNAQIFSWGWSADYPDPENFLFLLYGPNGKVKSQGENAVNYKNDEYDQLFEKMKVLPNGPKREALIHQMIDIAQKDTPWIWGYNPFLYTLSHQWMGEVKPNAFAHNTLKYIKIDTPLRSKQRTIWNQPMIWPLIGFILFFILLCCPAIIAYNRKMNRAP